jgi:parallel beta-helix repeat protein
MRVSQMRRKWVAIGIIFLFVGTCIVPTIAQSTEKPFPALKENWLYVGGNGPGNYTKIQDAIDNASNSDTISVYPGVYNERIEIHKRIHLRGADPHTTLIDGQGMNTDVITCVATNVMINGFTIGNCSLTHSCILVNHTANCSLIENIIHTGGYGVNVRNADNISITNNTFFDTLATSSGYIGVNINNGIFCTLSQNRISSWTGGLVLHGTHLLISQNTITNTSRGITDTLNTLPQTNTYLTIDQNHINGTRDGIYLAGSTDYTITQNEITNSTVVGIYLAESSYTSVRPENITITRNIIATSAQAIYAEHAINISIEGNHIHQNTIGLLLTYDSRTSITRNTFEDNNKTVVYQWAVFPLSPMSHKIPRFDMNFWGCGHTSPHPIIGRWGVFEPCFLFDPLNLFPCVTFDWHPAQEPYNRGG